MLYIVSEYASQGEIFGKKGKKNADAYIINSRCVALNARTFTVD